MASHSKRLLRKSFPGALIIGEIIVGGLLSIGSFIVFSKIMLEVIQESTQSVDVMVSEYLYSFRTSELTFLLRTVTYFGNEIIFCGMGILLGIFLWKKYFDEALLLFVGVGGGYALSVIIKFIIQRPRPDLSPLYQEVLSSFPSGHSMISLVFYSLLVFLFFRLTRRLWLSLGLGIGASMLILLIGVSRVYLGVHYPSDVLAGFVAGIWWVMTVLVVYKTLGYIRSRN